MRCLLNAHAAWRASFVQPYDSFYLGHHDARSTGDKARVSADRALRFGLVLHMFLVHSRIPTTENYIPETA